LTAYQLVICRSRYREALRLSPADIWELVEWIDSIPDIERAYTLSNLSPPEAEWEPEHTRTDDTLLALDVGSDPYPGWPVHCERVLSADDHGTRFACAPALNATLARALGAESSAPRSRPMDTPTPTRVVMPNPNAASPRRQGMRRLPVLAPRLAQAHSVQAPGTDRRDS
jgi:hypothetical protein